MYVCVCQAVTERELHAAIDAGAVTLQHLRECLQVASCCGACTDHVKSCVRRALGQDRQEHHVFANPHADLGEPVSV